MDQSNAPSGQDEPHEDNQEVDSENDTLSMEALLEQGDFALDPPKKDEIRQGVIASISDNEILVSIGAKSEGVIPARELENLSEEERAKIQVGETIPVFVLNPESRQGGVLLSLERALETDDWARADELMQKNEVFEGAISGFNKGGLIVNLGRLRAFVPASQVSMTRRMSYQGDTPEEKWGEMKGEPIVTRVIEVDRQRRRLILSEKAASQESRESLKDRLLEELREGEIRTGRVTSLADFGAFVNINGADGLVHLSEISWDRINNPNEVLEVGQEVEVKVISLDKERKRIGLSLRQLHEDPWLDKIANFQVGHLVEGTITRLAKFGAFARIDDDLEGLVHVSELSEKRVEHPKEMVVEGEQLTLRIIKIDEKRRRIGLSLRKVTSGAYSDVDWEMTLAEIDDLAEQDEDGDDADPRMVEGVDEDVSLKEEEPITEEEKKEPESDTDEIESSDQGEDDEGNMDEASGTDTVEDPASDGESTDEDDSQTDMAAGVDEAASLKEDEPITEEDKKEPDSETEETASSDQGEDDEGNMDAASGTDTVEDPASDGKSTDEEDSQTEMVAGVEEDVSLKEEEPITEEDKKEPDSETDETASSDQGEDDEGNMDEASGTDTIEDPDSDGESTDEDDSQTDNANTVDETPLDEELSEDEDQ
jgi:small subunit ribosomal protein S1